MSLGKTLKFYRVLVYTQEAVAPYDVTEKLLNWTLNLNTDEQQKLLDRFGVHSMKTNKIENMPIEIDLKRK